MVPDPPDSASALAPADLIALQASLSAGRAAPASLITSNALALWYEYAANPPGDARLADALVIVARGDDPTLTRFVGDAHGANGGVGDHGDLRDGYVWRRVPADAANAHALRDALPWLRPAPLGMRAGVGVGDRLGLATSGHALAIRHAGLADEHWPPTPVGSATAGARGIAPIFAQQSIREMGRLRRSPQAVMDDAMWGLFQVGWRGAWGADADHLKTTDDIDACAAAGYTFYTFDPGAGVDDTADAVTPDALRARYDELPWGQLETTAGDLERRYVGREITLETQALRPTAEEVTRAAVKYGAAIALVTRMYRHLAAKHIPFEVEISVDETAAPTSVFEHVFFVCELARLGVHWVSLAPRFVGGFEKGIDYIGDLAALRRNLADHAEVARTYGPYLLSLHSGSDKFSVYPLIAEATRGGWRLKTSGTSYLEALRVVALNDPALFRAILAIARERFAQDSASYHITADLSALPDGSAYDDAALPTLLDDPLARQALHVTYGSALAAQGAPLLALLRRHRAEYERTLITHFARHLAPFAEIGQ